MSIILLAIVLLGSLVLIPLGLPGTWVMVAAAAAYGPLTGREVGWVTVIGVALLAVVAEVFEWSLAGRFARKYGGSKRASWGAVIGGTVGAFAGIPIPVIGSLIGALIGSFAGALVGEMTGGTGAVGATRVATGALLGRATAVAMKVTVGLIMAIWIVAVAVLE